MSISLGKLISAQEKSSDILTRQYYQILLSSSILATVGALTQLVTSIVTLRTDPRVSNDVAIISNACGMVIETFLVTDMQIIYSRLRLWETINATVIIVFTVAAIVPFLMNPSDNSYTEITEIWAVLKTKIVLFFLHAKEIPQIIPLLLTDNFTLFYLLLCTNINASVIFLIVNLFCMCNPKKSLVRAKQKDQEQKIPPGYFEDKGSVCDTLNQSIRRGSTVYGNYDSQNRSVKHYI